MFFRFAAALSLVVLISMTGVALEKRTLELRRQVSLQHYQKDLLVEQHVRLRLETQRLTAPSRWAGQRFRESQNGPAGAIHRAAPDLMPTDDSDTRAGRLPLLRFQYPLQPEEIR